MAEHERADSRFTVLATVSDGEVERRTTVRGRDIYGVTAPMIAAAARALSAEPIQIPRENYQLNQDERDAIAAAVTARQPTAGTTQALCDRRVRPQRVGPDTGRA